MIVDAGFGYALSADTPLGLVVAPLQQYTLDVRAYYLCSVMTQLVTRAPPLIPQQLPGIIEAKRSQSLYNESCDFSALRMPRTCCGIKGGARLPIVS
jgi:hypothetical protein